MRRAVPVILCAAALSVLPSAVSPAGAQEPGAQEEIGGAFVDTLDVQAVNVEVVVTDRRGRRVTDLKAGDFRLLVDGEPVPLDYFAEIREGRAVPPPSVPGEAAPAALPPALTDLEAGDEVGTNYLVFIDEFFSSYRLRNEALKVLARDLGILRPRDRMAVVAFEGSRLRVVADWSAPSTALADTLRETARRKGFLNVNDLGGIRDLRPLKATGEFLMADTGLQPGDMEADRSESLLARKVLTAAAGALRTLEPPPGRKVALILSGGWKLDPRAAVNRFDQAQEYASWGDSLALLRPLTDEANRLGYTVYPIHLADTPLPSAADRIVVGEPTVFALAGTAMADAVRQGSLVFSAEETGGRLLRSGAPHLKRIAEDTRSYYWLGFSSSGGKKRQGLKVEVLRDGLEVRSRSSFLPISRAARSAMSIEGALLTGKPVPGAGKLFVQVGTPEDRGSSTVSVPLALGLPVEGITLLPEEGRLVANLEVWITSIDSAGGRSDLVITPAALAVAEQPAPGKHVVYRSSVVLRRAKQEVLLSVVDSASGETFSARVPLDLSPAP